jgi:protein-S-isoprenylcysteine O-methyltransferase Ste14
MQGKSRRRRTRTPSFARGAAPGAEARRLGVRSRCAQIFEGRGTPAPTAPTERLVVGGLYRHVRNPMYLAVGATIVGQALVLGRPLLLAYAAAFGLVVATFVWSYEEPTLSARYGEQYAAYRRAVPAWWPRLRPWTPKPRQR